MPSLIGTKILDPLNVEVALTIYAFALMLRTTADGLASVDGDVKLSASAIGFAGVLSGPLVRSSYRAGRLYAQAMAAR